MKKRVIILGDSPFMERVADRLNYVTERFYTLGINNSITKFNTHCHVFIDNKFIPLTNSRQDLKTITLYMFGDLIQKENKELYDTFPLGTGSEIVRDGKLAWAGFTHDYAISYCIFKGYKEIILIGAADFEQNGHYATDEDFNYSQLLKRKSVNFIENVCNKLITIKTCNPNSTLNIEKIDINSLL